MDSQSQIEELRDYKPDGTPVKRYWMEPGDKWWDFGFYFHVVVLIGAWMLYDAATTHYMTRAQFMLNHTITVIWVFAAGIYSAYAVVVDVIAAGKKRKRKQDTGSQ